ncbi:hypothetical protein BFW01_g4925 [Lasiodiplodia theobromae]|uniref:Putative sugar phosphate/phosphate translocator n=1 Tax=Lasiodiplodia theobromae TaxID=45133 RepID=A0A5N5DPF4_9PEZI|nr:uncharacterized protein LTHEOB_6200 [Lasiodiplodia theobromae]KAB2579607.1 putative sugar phosphate/phosphate translocator [Lasiodiplodia theobromae]KAF4544630.1 hypothetical protein LTHEOB_6200 [Lasiodiplodia theobromae]KAF9634030.1 hypothetical protein BFW01_g4925 [Lasiodiplodia theobromae]
MASAKDDVNLRGPDDVSDDERESSQFLPAPATQQEPEDKLAAIPVWIFAVFWIAASGGVILFNKWILHTLQFSFPIFLTTWHLTFATIVTQCLARYTNLLDSRHKVPMTREVYMRAIMPIAVFNSLSLICGNVAYLYLSVSFIQMLKATNAVVTLLVTWALGQAQPNVSKLYQVVFIVIGVFIASVGEIKFDLFGFLIQMSGVGFEATRLVLVQRVLSAPEFKMDPLVSLYYYAPATVLTNALPTLIFEYPKLTGAELAKVGFFTLIANASVAFMLNFAVVLFIKRTSAVTLTLCGVLKDILLVVASVVIFWDPVTGTQIFGYGIALAGLMYYKLGPEKFWEIVKKPLGGAR